MSPTEAAFIALVGIPNLGIWILGLLVCVASIEDYYHQRGFAARKTTRMVDAQIAREKDFSAAQATRLAGGGGE